MAAYDDKSPLETAIDEGRMEIWNIMREGLELSETEKLEQLCRMIVAGKMDPDDPWKEFNELLSSLPVELVFTGTYFGTEYMYCIFPRISTPLLISTSPILAILETCPSKRVNLSSPYSTCSPAISLPSFYQY